MKHVICILSFRRADILYKRTYKLIRAAGYNDDEIFIFVSDDDETQEDYKKKFKNVIIFKRNYFETDERINRKEKTALHARNFIYKYCRDNNIEAFITLDDDYKCFCYIGCKVTVKSLKKINEKIFDAFKSMPPRIKLIALAQSGDFVCSQRIFIANQKIFCRKVMNYFYCLSSRPVGWIGVLNNDTCTYAKLANIGELCFTVWGIHLHQPRTQKNSGGLTDLYKSEGGTYLKAFYPLLAHPTAVRIKFLGTNDFRLHHSIVWKKLASAVLKK